jgi:hypothetical protein
MIASAQKTPFRTALERGYGFAEVIPNLCDQPGARLILSQTSPRRARLSFSKLVLLWDSGRFTPAKGC